MRHTRFTVRRLMFTVAVVAIVLAAGMEAARPARISADRTRYAESCAASEAFGRKFASGYTRLAQSERQQLDSLRSQPAGMDQSAVDLAAARWETDISLALDRAATYRTNADYWGSMRRKYEQAARAPCACARARPAASRVRPHALLSDRE